MISCPPMRTTYRASRLVRRGVALAATGLLSLGGVWVQAQDADRDAAASAPAPDREHVPTLTELQATLTRLRRDVGVSVGGPALEHAGLALGRARAAESAQDAGEAGSGDEALRARRIAYAALTLAEVQRERERARLARDEAAQARHDAEGAERTASEALRVARANAAATRVEPAMPAVEPAPAPAEPAPSAATYEAAP